YRKQSYERADEKEDDFDRYFKAVAESGLDAIPEAGGVNESSWGLEDDVDGGEAGLAVEKSFGALQLFDLGADIVEVFLHVEGVFDLPGALHDLKYLGFQGFLVLNPRFQVDVLFSDVLTGFLLLNHARAHCANFFHGGTELCRGYPDLKRYRDFRFVL